MAFFDRLFGKNSNASTEQKSHQLPSKLVVREFGEVNVRKTNAEIQVQFTILMEPQGKDSEGWQTGVALDASTSMKGWYGRMIEGKIPSELEKEYEKKGWVATAVKDGKKVKTFQGEAINDAVNKGRLKTTPNIVQPIAREFISYLAGKLDADGGTTVIYWACEDGKAIEVLGDFTESECKTLDVLGPDNVSFGAGTVLTPAVQYFVERFKDAPRGMYIFLTDGKIEDLPDVISYTIQIAREIESGAKKTVKCVLIGVGSEIDISQMEELDDLDTGTDIDIWDHKIAKDMRSLMEIFAEVVDENQIVAPVGTLYDSSGQVIKAFFDGVPAKIQFTMPLTSQWFELEVAGQRIKQTVVDNSI